MIVGVGGGVPPGCLVAETTSFVDRPRDVAEVRRMLTVARLVTLAGPGGAGKTRLAVRIAGGLARAFADGISPVDLTTVGDGSLVEYAVADALGLRSTAEIPTAWQLVDYLADRELLLVLDNCEHVLDACAAVAARLLSAAPGLRILCTSRQPLGMLGEMVWTVAPLPAADAVRLFADRAADAAPGFAVTVDSRQSIVDICERLDGLPLAIELAAAQLRTHTLADVVEGLADRTRLPLAETFDWSHALCTPGEQALWARASVFAGSFDLDAATAVCAGADLPAESMLTAVAGLVDKSVLAREERLGAARYRMLQTVRDYGAARLADRELDRAAVRRLHRDRYLRLAELFEAEWFGPTQEDLLALLRLEWPNLRAAIDYCLTEPGEAQTGLRLTAALLYFWLAGGVLREGWHWLDRALATDPAPTAFRARALYACCRLMVGAYAAQADTAAHIEECAALADRLGDPALVARAQHVIGLGAQFGSELPRAEASLRKAVDGFAVLGEVDASAVSARFSLALTMLFRGDTARAVGVFAECYVVSLAHGDRWVRSQTLGGLGLAALDQGDAVRAAAYTRERLKIKRALGDTLGLATAVETMAAVAATTGEWTRATQLAGAAEGMWQRQLGPRSFGAVQFARWLDHHLAGVRVALGAAAFDEAFQLGMAMEPDRAVAYALEENPAPAPAPAPPRSGRTQPVRHGSLTRREQQVAELVTEGLTNRQIATRLAISPRTAECHVENALAKLGLSSRTQIVAWMLTGGVSAGSR